MVAISRIFITAIVLLFLSINYATAQSACSALGGPIIVIEDDLIILRIAPNPVSTHLEIWDTQEIDIREICLVNQSGEVVKHSTPYASYTQIETDDIPPGIYSLYLRTYQATYYKTIVVAHP
jgi:hypothetical protein